MLENEKNSPLEINKFYVCYVTANEADYEADKANLTNLAIFDSGVDRVYLYIAISLVESKSQKDLEFEDWVFNLFLDHSQIVVNGVFFKSNHGRDFSSYALLAREVKRVERGDAFILFKNRSALGPKNDDWFLIFLKQFCRFDNVGLCGATINFLDHPLLSDSCRRPHVQTYVFLTRLKMIYPILSNFPGENSEVRLDIIDKGEFGLSEFFLNNGYSLTCIEWPDEDITASTWGWRYTIGDLKERPRNLKHYIHRRSLDFHPKTNKFKIFIHSIRTFNTRFKRLVSMFLYQFKQRVMRSRKGAGI